MAGPRKKITLLEVAAYLFLLSVCAKGVFLYENRHPPKEALLSVEGTVKKVRLGGDGKSTVLTVESGNGVHEYFSYYGKVWPGMERIRVGDPVHLRAERDRLNQRELITGRKYYIWELTHRDRRIVRYEDVLAEVRGAEATVNRFITIGMEIGFVFLLVAYVRKRRMDGA